MQFPTIRQGGEPQIDGTITRYLAPDLIGKPWYNPSRPVIFVNGMLNDGAGHQRAAETLSMTLGAQVYGVLNRTDGGFADLWQCITDKFRFATVQTPDQKVYAQISLANSGFDRRHDAVEAGYQAVRAVQPGLSKDAYVLSLLGHNAATVALYRLLLGQPGGMLGTPIHAHSQGNLITSNALTAVALARGSDAIQGLEVVSYGSPAQGWPPGLRRTNNAFTFDGVGALDGTLDLSSSKVGYKFSHGLPAIHQFRYYADHDAEFVVNRFRTGSWGMTVNMDEKGLAQFCAALGNNTERLRRIFDRLEKVHFTDSDDVALEFCRIKSDAELAELARIDPMLTAQLIRLLKAGYTSGSEQAAIDRLEAALKVNSNTAA